MEFGYVLAGQYLSEDDPRDRLREAIEQVAAAREAGFTSIWATQHFLADFQFLQTVPFLARLSAEAGGMAIGTGVLIAPLYPPVLLAEEVATLDVLAGGKFILGVGAGYRDAEFGAFGVPKRERLGRLAEMIELQRELWSGRPVDYHGRYLTLSGAQLRLPPPQRERLPIWIGAQGPKGIALAARLGDEWLVSPEVPHDVIAERQVLYRQLLPAGVDPEDKVYPLMREAYTAPSRSEALRIAGPALRTKYAAYASWGHTVGTFEESAETSFVLGSVDDCVEAVDRYRRLGCRFLGLRMQWPGLEQRRVLDSIAGFGDVIARCQD